MTIPSLESISRRARVLAARLVLRAAECSGNLAAIEVAHRRLTDAEINLWLENQT